MSDQTATEERIRPSRQTTVSGRSSGDADAAIVEICDAVGAFIKYWGFKEVHGRVWTYMVLHSQAVSQAKVARGLGLSRASVSVSIKELAAYGLVEKVGEERLAPHVAVVDAWPVITNVLSTRERVLLEGAETSLLRGIKALRDLKGSGAQTPFSEERLLVLLSLTDMAKAGLATIIRLRLPPSIGALRKRFDSMKGMVKLVRLWA